MIQQTIKIFGKNLKLSMRNDGDQAVANEVFRDRGYKPCDEVIQNATHAMIDIGGHAGFFSLYAATLNSKIPIYSFEPHSGNYKMLKENLKQNRIKNVNPKNLAVADHAGEVELHTSQEDLNHSIVHAIEAIGETQKVNSITLERILEKNKLDQVDLIKMDCEGAEFQILRSTSKNSFEKINHIFLEYHDWIPNENHRELKIYLEKMGYQVQDFPNHKMSELGFLWATKK